MEKFKYQVDDEVEINCGSEAQPVWTRAKINGIRRKHNGLWISWSSSDRTYGAMYERTAVTCIRPYVAPKPLTSPSCSTGTPSSGT